MRTKTCDRALHELKGEGRSNKTPRDRCDDGNNEGPKETSVKDVLDPVGDSEDVFFSRFDLDSSDAGDEEHAGNKTNLAPNQEISKVVIVVLKENLTGILAKTPKTASPRSACVILTTAK